MGYADGQIMHCIVPKTNLNFYFLDEYKNLAWMHSWPLNAKISHNTSLGMMFWSLVVHTYTFRHGLHNKKFLSHAAPTAQNCHISYFLWHNGQWAEIVHIALSRSLVMQRSFESWTCSWFMKHVPMKRKREFICKSWTIFLWSFLMTQPRVH